MSHRATKLSIAGIWLFSSLVAMPWLFYFTIVPFQLADGRFVETCVESWPSKRMDTTYFLGANLVLMYLLPAILLIICHICISCALGRHNVLGDSRSEDDKQNLMIERSKLKSMRISTLVLVLFLSSWLPLYIVMARVKLISRELDLVEDWLIISMIPFAQW